MKSEDKKNKCLQHQAELLQVRNHTLINITTVRYKSLEHLVFNLTNVYLIATAHNQGYFHFALFRLSAN